MRTIAKSLKRQVRSTESSHMVKTIMQLTAFRGIALTHYVCDSSAVKFCNSKLTSLWTVNNQQLPARKTLQVIRQPYTPSSMVWLLPFLETVFVCLLIYCGRFWVTKSVKKVLKKVLKTMNSLKKVLKKVKFHSKSSQIVRNHSKN